MRQKEIRVSGRAVLILWLIAAALSAYGIGQYLDEAITGIVSDHRSWRSALIGVGVTVLVLSITILWAKDRRRTTPQGTVEQESGRRRFLVGLASAAGGILVTGGAALIRPRGWIAVTGPAIGPPVPTDEGSPRKEWAGSRIQSYRRLGRTNFEVSDIALGSARIDGLVGERLAREAIDRGVNYFDTSPDYSESGSELALGKAMKGHRNRMFLATKFCTPTGHLQAGAPVSQYMQVVEGSLKRLQTDYVDLVHIHACDTLERLLDPNVHEAFQRLKQQGKARFLGFSSHTPNLEAVTEAAIADGRFDVMMLAYHHGAWPKLGSLIERAAEKDIGIVAMKTLKGAKHRGLLEFRPEADSYAQAAFKWVLGNPNVSCLVISFFKPEHVDEYLYASGKKLTDRDLAFLKKYDQLIAGKYCFPHCGQCLQSCPYEVAINDVLRYRMYFEDYGNEKEAMRLYAALDKKADLCIGCAAPCTGACPEGVAIQERMIGAHEMLTFA
jgi:hypothetical protein